MPPRTNPHWRTPPSASSLAWSCSSTYAVPGRRRPRHAVVDRVPAERGLHVLGLEPLRQELVRARREQERQVGEPLALPQAERAPLRQRPEVAQRPHARIGRGPVERRAARPARARRDRPRTAAAPARRPSRTAASLDVGGHVVAQVVVRAVRIQVQRRTRPDRRRCRAARAHVAPDRLAQHREHVGARRRAVAGRELLGVAGAPDDVAAARARGFFSLERLRHQAALPAPASDRPSPLNYHHAKRADWF